MMSCIFRGRPLGTATTHFQFEQDKVKEFNPSQVDGGEWATFELDSSSKLKRFTMTSEWVGKQNTPSRRVDRWLYDLTGDTLRLCWPNIFGEYPDQLSEQVHGVFTLIRDHGPLPTTKARSGKQPIQDPLLGEVKWDDNYDHWKARLEVKSGVVIDFYIEPGDQTDEIALEAGRTLAQWLRAHEGDGRRYAASQLLDDHNENWNDSDQISAEDFASRMTLETVALSPNGAGSLYYADGGLFGGHCIIVSQNRNREFTYAHFAG